MSAEGSLSGHLFFPTDDPKPNENRLIRVVRRLSQKGSPKRRALLRNLLTVTGQKSPLPLQLVCLGASAGLGLAKGFVRELFLLP